VIITSSLSPRCCCAREGMRAKGGMRTRCGPSGHDSADDDAVAIVRLRSSRCRRHRVAVASARGVRGRVGQGEVGEWSRRRHGDRVVMIITTLSLPRHCCECDGVWAKAGQAQAWCVHEVGVTWIQGYVGMRREPEGGEGHARRKGDANGGGGKRGRRASDCGRWWWRWRVRASGGTVEALTRPQTRRGVILGDARLLRGMVSQTHFRCR
jgi:hypothetical protein